MISDSTGEFTKLRFQMIVHVPEPESLDLGRPRRQVCFDLLLARMCGMEPARRPALIFDSWGGDMRTIPGFVIPQNERPRVRPPGFSGRFTAKSRPRLCLRYRRGRVTGLLMHGHI
jgi:hypothetical protein